MLSTVPGPHDPHGLTTDAEQAHDPTLVLSVMALEMVLYSQALGGSMNTRVSGWTTNLLVELAPAPSADIPRSEQPKVLAWS